MLFNYFNLKLFKTNAKTHKKKEQVALFLNIFFFYEHRTCGVLFKFNNHFLEDFIHLYEMTFRSSFALNQIKKNFLLNQSSDLKILFSSFILLNFRIEAWGFYSIK
ncbi:hypothetical protein BpHYR1_054204 [Brachionus plicatilis]|uniref:Uncharacterized protein n=1 Tax=Brachionus plicatilis TaxID=10195 RepID=A0A3M7RIR7_BRAPC|nr:hypothetical protein BpHYR1_054204 [Brachionus plicatilis]